MKNELHEKVEDLRVEIERSEFYWEKRLSFWTGLSVASKYIDALLSATAFASILAQYHSVAMGLTLLSSIMAISVLVFQAEKRIKFCMQQKAAYTMLEGEMPVLSSQESEQRLADLTSRYKKIEKVEGVILFCVNAVCHGMVLTKHGGKPRYRLSLLERTLGQLVPLSYEPKEVGGKIDNH